MMKYVVYFENWNGAEIDAVFHNREDAERYIAECEEELTSEEEMYIVEEER